MKHGFHLISRFRDNTHLCYVYEGGRTGKPGRPKTIGGKINLKKLDMSRVMPIFVDGLPGLLMTDTFLTK